MSLSHDKQEMEEEDDQSQVVKPAADAKTPGKIRKHTVLETSKGRVYVCKLCSETFDKSYALANHVKSFCPKRALFKRDSSSYLSNSETVPSTEQESIQDEPSPEVKTSKRLRSAKRHRFVQESTAPSSHSTPPATDTYEDPLRSTHPSSGRLDEYEKSFLPNYPLDLVFKLKSLKALQIAMSSSLITPEQYAAKQLLFIKSINF
eukprot:Phypoly_transcript_10772.p1 GENE.Phypoly_transcript_10772~~Phypoly_transcript_10772.p1  ORF type:complete len:205 (+),score=26.59 Phypoly_transcript_10772:192-806(+)